ERKSIPFMNRDAWKRDDNNALFLIANLSDASQLFEPERHRIFGDHRSSPLPTSENALNCGSYLSGLDITKNCQDAIIRNHDLRIKTLQIGDSCRPNRLLRAVHIKAIPALSKQ